MGDVPEISALWQASVRTGVWHVLHELVVTTHDWEEFFDGKLVVAGHVYLPDFGELEQLFLIHKHLFEEVFVAHLLGWRVELDYRGGEAWKEAGYLRCSLKYLRKSSLARKRPKISCGITRLFLVPMSGAACGYCYCILV